MTDEEKAIEGAAFRYAQQHRSALAHQIADPHLYPAEDEPQTVFMAGSPGAGKTEVSKAMKDALEEGENTDAKVLRIDPDEFRCLLPGYTGCNSYLFQQAVTKILEKVLDRAFEKKMSFILDGTMANLDVAKKNIDRVLRKNGTAHIMYVYQRPELAWKFVQAREITEGRNIPLTEFVRQYFCVRKNIKEILNIYDNKRVQVDLIIKNTDSVGEGYEFDVTSDQIDGLIPETYDHDLLLAFLKSE